MDDVLGYLRQAISDAQSDYNNLVGEAEAEKERLNELISGLNNDIQDMQNEYAENIVTIRSLNEDVEAAEARITNLEGELD